MLKDDVGFRRWAAGRRRVHALAAIATLAAAL